jgi:hypothetical protein
MSFFIHCCDECRHAECHCDECRHAECRGTKILTFRYHLEIYYLVTPTIVDIFLKSALQIHFFYKFIN